MDAAETSRRWPRTRWLVLAVMLAAGAIRLVGVFWALPYLPHPDEPFNMGVIQHMVIDRTANPEKFGYPSLFYDIQSVAHAGYVAAGVVTGRFDSAADVGMIDTLTLGVSKAPRPVAVMVARLVSVVASVLTVALVALVVRLAGGRRAAVVGAAGLAAITPILVGYSWFVTPDTLSGLTATAAAAGALWVLRRGTVIDHAIAGALVGLAAGSKYNAAAVAVAVLTAHVLRWRLAHLERLVLAGATSVVVFVITTPFSVLDWSRFRDNVGRIADQYSTGHIGSQGASWQTNATWLFACFGLLLVALVGLWWARDRRAVMVLASYAATYYVVVSLPIVRFERNLVPVVPTIAALIALGAEGWWRWTSDHREVRIARVGVAALVVVGTAWPVIGTVRRVEAAIHDPTAAARQWIEAQVPAGSTVVIDAYSPYVDPARWDVVPVRFVLAQPSDVAAADPDVVVVTQTGSGRYLDLGDAGAIERFALLEASACERVSFDDDGVWIFVLRCR